MSVEVVRVLTEARARVAKAWVQGEYGDVDDGVCLIGAMNLAVGLPVDSEGLPGGVERKAYELLRAAGVAPDVAPWNDAPGRTQAEVVAALDNAIALAQAQP